MAWNEKVLSKRVPERSGGLLLVELMMTLLVLVVGVLGLAGAMMLAIRDQSASRQRFQVCRALSTKLEEVSKTPFDSIATTYNNTQFQVSIGGVNPSYSSSLISVKTLDPRVLAVTITATWTGNNGPETFALYQEIGK